MLHCAITEKVKLGRIIGIVVATVIFVMLFSTGYYFCNALRENCKYSLRCQL
jgi:hypothetical protein